MPETRSSGVVTVQNLAPTTAVPKGYGADAATGTVRGLNNLTSGIPAGATYCIIQVRGGLIQWRDDGVNPTAADGGGMPLGYDASILGTSASIVYDADLTAFKYILRSGTPRLDVVFYG